MIDFMAGLIQTCPDPTPATTTTGKKNVILLSIPFPGIDPVAFHLGPFPIRWYGLAYAAGLVLGWLYIRKLAATGALWPATAGKAPLNQDQIDSLLLWTAAGVILGGRLIGILLYDVQDYVQEPWRILETWKGGMSFHGGLLGVVIALLLFARRHAVNVFSVGDLVAAAVPVGIFFGRIANFINGELWGRPATVPWAMVFPEPAAGGLARHPSQLYEAVLEGLVLFLVLRILTHGMGKLARPGFVAGAFLAGYAVARSFCELFREGDPNWLFPTGAVTTGMIYSLPMLIAGLYLMMRARPEKTSGGAATTGTP